MLVSTANDARLRAAGWLAAFYLASTVILLTAACVFTSFFPSTGIDQAAHLQHYTYYHNTRLGLVFACATLVVCGSSIIVSELMLSSLDRSPSIVPMAHSACIAIAGALCGLVGYLNDVLVVNSAVPRLVVSLDVIVIVWLQSYVVRLLRELFGGLVLSTDDAWWGPPLVVWWRRHILRTRAGEWAEFASLSLGTVALGISRLMVERDVAAAVLMFSFCSFAPSFVSALLLALDACYYCDHMPVIRHFSAAFLALAVFFAAAVTCIEPLYQFSEFFPHSPGPFISDCIIFCSFTPYVLATLTCYSVAHALQRTELLQARLQASALQASARLSAAESREQVLRWLAHEARGPLNSLYMGLQLLNAPGSALKAFLPPGHEDRDVLGMCCLSADQVVGVLGDVLELSKLSVGGIVLRIKTGTVSNMLTDVAEEMGLMAEEHSVVLQVTIPRPEVMMSSLDEQADFFGSPGGNDSVQLSSPLVFDKLHVSQVVASFTSNAIKFSAPGAQVVLAARVVERHVVPLPSHLEPQCGMPGSRVQSQPATLLSALRELESASGAGRTQLGPDAPANSHSSKRGPGGRWPFMGGTATVKPDFVPRNRGTATMSLSPLVDESLPQFPATASGSAQRAIQATALHCRARRGPPAPRIFIVQRSAGSVDLTKLVPHLDPSQLQLDDNGRAVIAIIEVAVEDRGCGIGEADAERLFEEFQQIEAGASSRNLKGKSTGLGLAISRRVAAALGGVVGVQSTPGSGSRFYFRFPAALGRGSTTLLRSGSGPTAMNDLRPVVAHSMSGGGSIRDGTPRHADSQVAPSFRDDGKALARARYHLRNNQDASAPLGGLNEDSPDVTIGARLDTVRALGGSALQQQLHGELELPERSSWAPLRASAAVPAELDGHVAVPLLHGLRILTVDDSALSLKLLARTLRAALSHVPLLVTEVGDGQAGLDAVAAAAASGVPFDILLVDGEMPVVDGYGMVATLRARGDATPAIGVTGNVLPGDVQRFIDAGAACVVAKPVRMPDLLAAMRRVLGEARVPGSGE